MRSQIGTFAFRRFINAVVDSTETTPSLGEMVHHHLEVDWARMKSSHYHALIAVHDARERWIELRIDDARVYPDALYERGRALLSIGVNGALVTPEDEDRARQAFRTRVFRTCRTCGERFSSWLDYYAHIKTAHWEADGLLGA